MTCCSLQAIFNPTCAFCLFVIKKLEGLLPHNVTEVTLCGKHVLYRVTWCKGHHFSLSLQDALVKLMGEVCDLLPESYKNQCDDFIAKYGTEIVEFLLSSAAPHTICTLLHLCLFEEQTVPGQSHWTESWCYWLDSTLTLPTLCWQQSRLFPRTASPAARWPYWADSTTAPTPPNPKPPLSSSLCASFTPTPSPRSDPQQPLNSL